MARADSLAQRVRQARLAAQLTYVALAQAADVSVATIYLIESGKRVNVSLPTLRKLAQALNVDVMHLVDVPDSG